MLFSNLAALVQKGVTVQFVVSKAADGKLEVAVHPSTERASGMNLVAKSFVGTPAELDAEFAEIIGGYAVANLSLRDQLEAVQVMVKEAEKQASEEAATKAAEAAKKAAAKPASKPTAAASSKPLPAAKPSPSLLDGGEEDADADSEGKSDSAETSGDAEPMAFTL